GTPATATAAATPDPSLFRVRSSVAPGGPLQRCSVAGPLEGHTTAASAGLWEDLLARARYADPELARRLDLFRECGCALTVADSQGRFGPFADYADCDWTDADDWRHDFGHHLGPYEQALRGLLAGLLAAAGATAVDPDESAPSAPSPDGQGIPETMAVPS